MDEQQAVYVQENIQLQMKVLQRLSMTMPQKIYDYASEDISKKSQVFI